MIYQEFKPSKKLSSLIACYWSIKFDTNFDLLDWDIVLPDGCTELVLNFGSPFYQQDLLSGSKCLIDEYAIIGPRTRAITISQPSSAQLFAIRFKSQGLQALIKIPSPELCNQVIFNKKKLKKISCCRLGLQEKNHSPCQ